MPPILTDLIRNRRAPRPNAADDVASNQQLAQTAYGSFHFENRDSFQALHESYFRREVFRFNTTTSVPFIIDGGANIGVSCRYWKHLYPDAEIVAFEPDEHVFALLEQNMAGHSGFTARKMALWSSDGRLTFNALGGEGGHLDVLTDRVTDGLKQSSVPTFRLRNLLDRKVDLLKLDIEGAELEVLRDCGDRLHNVSMLFVEHHSFLGRPQQLGEFFSILEAAGFRVNMHVDIVSPQPFQRRIVYNHKDSWLNIFAFRE